MQFIYAKAGRKVHIPIVEIISVIIIIKDITTARRAKKSPMKR